MNTPVHSLSFLMLRVHPNEWRQAQEEGDVLRVLRYDTLEWIAAQKAQDEKRLKIFASLANPPQLGQRVYHQQWREAVELDDRPTMVRVNTMEMIEAIKTNDMKRVRAYLPLSNPRKLNYQPLRTALTLGNLPAAELMFDAAPPPPGVALLNAAVEKDSVEATQWLCERLRFKKTHKSLVHAARNGSYRCVEWLIAHTNSGPKLNSSQPLQEAIIRHHPRCVHALLAHSNVAANFSLALQNTALHNPGLMHMIEPLSSLEDAQNALKARRPPGYEKALIVLTDCALRKHLHSEFINASPRPSPKRM